MFDLITLRYLKPVIVIIDRQTQLAILGSRRNSLERTKGKKEKEETTEKK